MPRPISPLSGNTLPVAAALLLAYCLAQLFLRHAFPFDETRYLAVAWEMWLRDDFLVPYVNGMPYSHKPPLLFWLMQAGWWLFGVSEWWPRLIPCLFALASLVLVRRLALLLWPGKDGPAQLAPLVLLSLPLWLFFSGLLLFDLVLVAFVLVSVYGAVLSLEDQQRGWAYLVFGLALGLLTKGPVMLLDSLPVILLAPFWYPQTKRRWGRWYAGVLAASLAGSLLALAWAVPAALSGGEEYARMIGWHQTADRLGKGYMHARPWWWYLPLLIPLLFPWLFHPGLWQGLKRPLLDDNGVRFCLAWLMPVFLLLSLIGGKKVHYLVPLLPPAALLISRLLGNRAPSAPLRGAWLPGLLIALSGVLLSAIPLYLGRSPGHGWLRELSPLWGLVVLAIGVMLFFAARRTADFDRRLALAATLATATALIGAFSTAAPYHDLSGISHRLASLQSAGHPLGHRGTHREQFMLLGRLRRPLEKIPPGGVAAWARQHPDGYVATYFKYGKLPQGIKPLFRQPYRSSRILVLYSSAQILTAPERFAHAGR